MNAKRVIGVLGLLVVAAGIAMLTAVPISLLFDGVDAIALLSSSVITILTGAALGVVGRSDRSNLRVREGFAIVTFGWILIPLFGALPFLLSNSIPSFTDAYFESVSGFTTTGASIVTDVEALPHGILYWRSLTHWLGGMGIVVLYLAILPMIGFGAVHLFKAEVSGMSKDKLTPRVVDTARILWGVYMLLTASEMGLLMLGGMSWFDALCHSFGTIATGGFSTKNASIGFYQSPYIDIVVTIYMLLAATNFSLHYAALRGNIGGYFRNEELRFFLVTYAFVVAVVTLATLHTNFDGNFADAFRYGAFNIASVMSCTGFATSDFALWVPLAQAMIFVAMFPGGCSGSTAGGIKMVRVYLLLKSVSTAVRRLLHRRAVVHIRLDGDVVDDDILVKVGAFVLFYVGFFVAASLILLETGLDAVAAFTATATCLAGIGPGLGSVGPMSNYHHLSDTGKYVLEVCMVVGRLELFTAIVLMSPAFWRS